MIRTDADYQALITSEHALKPHFVATVGASTSVFSYLQSMEFFVICTYDVDYAIGAGLDVIGEWVGISRKIPVPLTGVYFSWGGTMPAEGWGYGAWKGEFDPSSGIVDYPDDNYRQLIRAKIAANNSDGSTDSIYAIFEAAFPGAGVSVIDNQDMTIEIEYTGADYTTMQKAIISNGLMPIKISGVAITYTEV